ncbi:MULTISPECIES: hypothetical protein [unclassified Deinococcus]|uniref:hypothetical protein n=1 Tax=unclassified Deinococcus TaxID=2623546 RepID=UPI0010562C72|nr:MULTISPECIES: hypothetical protein [unclassified Deinococcus]MBI0444932.1 hypothetical protein [Deinococcus sp. DB0503]TDE85996.1 hypothetical protein E0686_09140 [Deinococcus sp. S9]
MTDHDHRYGDQPLGKSVEEVEEESSNRVNSPVPGEQIQDDALGAGVVVPPVLGGPSGGAMIPAVMDGERLTERADDGSGPDDGTAPNHRDSSEGTV